MNRREFIGFFAATAGVAALAPLAKLVVPEDTPVIDLRESLERIRQNIYRTINSGHWSCSGEYHLVMSREMWEEFENNLPSEIFTQEDGAFLEIIGGGTPGT